MYNTEENAKSHIDKLLEKSGWNILEDVEKELTVSNDPIQRADYILKGNNKEFLAVIEAKRKGEDLRLALDQGKRYAKEMDVKYVYSSNGEEIWFLNLFTGSRGKVSKFHPKEQLMSMINIEDPERNIYKGLPETLRPYQLEAINKTIEGVNSDKDKMFLEMATGTGKTFTTAALIEELIQTNKVRRVLFLVDRSNLAEQSLGSFQKTFQGRIPVGLITGKASDRSNRVLISTVQKLYSDGWDRKNETYSPLIDNDFFDLIVLDECHRSYYGEWHVVLDYFKGAIKLGLTATPAQLKDRDTYAYFGEPVYRYTYLQGVKDGFLCPSEITTIRTNVDMYGFYYKGNDFHQKDLEVNVNVPARNKLIVEEYRKRFPIPKKTMVFAVSKKHAVELADLFRQEYGEDAVGVIVSGGNDGVTQENIKRFRDPHSKLMIACTVDMLATGFDAPSVEVLVMARPTKSKILYYQMKGRGSRLYVDDKTGYEKKVFHILDFVDNVEHEYESKLVTAEVIEEADKTSSEGDSRVFSIEDQETREDVDNRRRLIIADGIEVWVEQEEFLTENEQKLKDILSNIGEQIEKRDADRRVMYKFKDNIISWEFFNPNELPSDEYLKKMDINLDEVREYYNLPNADLKQLVNLTMNREEDKTFNAKKKKMFESWMKSQGFDGEQERFLSMCFAAFSDNVEMDIKEIWQHQMIDSFGGLNRIDRMFGGPENVRDMIVRMQMLNELDY